MKWNNGGSVVLALWAVVATASEPPAACVAPMNAWCNSAAAGCVLPAATGPAIALHDRAASSSAQLWRCYDPSALDPATHSRYVAGTSYCTRDPQLAALERQCAPPAPTPAPAPPPSGPLSLLWPLPQQYTADPGGAPPVALADPERFAFCFRGANGTLALPPPTLSAAFGRYRAILFGAAASAGPGCAAASAAAAAPADGVAGPVLALLSVSVATLDETLDLDTNETYTLEIRGGSDADADAAAASDAAAAPTASVLAHSVYGVIRALETFAQLATPAASGSGGGGGGGGGALATPYTLATVDATLVLPACSIVDFPQYAWRGLMVDAGRRFWPVPLLRTVLDAMAYNKLNVLHLHLSDFCRFALESAAFPELTANLTGPQAGFYTAADVAGLVAYARQRGIRVVPEVDLPGHARGLLPLEAHGLRFCTAAADRSQVYDDPANSSFAVLSVLLAEVAALFPDAVLHAGSDETRSTGPCDAANTKSLEQKVLRRVGQLGKRPMAWVNALTTTGAATPHTILGTWATTYGMPGRVTAAGYACVASTYMYLNHIGGAVGSYTEYWRDITGGEVPPSAMPLMLGGEVSMWTDAYCYVNQCGASAGPTPVAAALYGPAADARFARSIAGVLFPRASVGAGSFWRYEPGYNASSAAFVRQMAAHNERLAARGVDTCPNNCTCDTLSRCGQPY